MKAEEFMTGDWVCIIDDDTDQSFNTRIAGVSELGNIYASLPGSEHIYPFSVDCLEPIPLTTEILEKNGFTCYGETWYIPHNNKNKSESVMVGFHMYCTEINIVNGNSVCYRKEVPCTYRAKNRHVYVHDLQHAIRLCGINKKIML